MNTRLALLGLASVLLSTGAPAAPSTPKSTPAAPKSKKRKSAPKAPAPVAAPAPAVEAAPAVAPPPPPAVEAPKAVEAPGTAVEPLKGRLQQAGDIDARVMFNADIVLAFVNVGVGADVGVMRLGPGVLSLGGEFEAGACVTVCLALNAFTGWRFGHFFYSPHARIAYHFIPGDGRGLEKVDLYGVLLAGAAFTTTRVAGSSSGADFEYQGSDVAPSGGLGVGAKYFVRDNLFLGAEARFRLASGMYTYTARVGNVTLSDTESSWSLSGLNVQLFGGLRF
jgi:hypothetical protein